MAEKQTDRLHFPLPSSSPRSFSSSIFNMSGASDKARFYLEQAIPQLQEFEQKKIFTKVRGSFLPWGIPET